MTRADPILELPALGGLMLIGAAGLAGAQAVADAPERRAELLAGLAVLLAALAGPLPALAGAWVWARVAQLLLIGGLAAPLLARVFGLARLALPPAPVALAFAALASLWAAPAPGLAGGPLAGPALLMAGLALWAALGGARARACGAGAAAALALAGWLALLGARLLGLGTGAAVPPGDARVAGALLLGPGAAVFAVAGARLTRNWLRRMDSLGV